MRFKALASGSNGNCVFIEGDRENSTRLLIDCGISAKRVATGLKELLVDPESLAGILITHEHSDHIQGLYTFSKHFHIPIYGTYRTLMDIAEHDLTGCIDPELFRVIEPGKEFSLGNFRVFPIPISHDAKDPVGYRLDHSGKSVAVVTDLGYYEDSLVEILHGISGLLLEANHDIRMLEAGRYPYALKRRILSDYGHLSNETAGKLLAAVLNPNLRFALLGHISEENNYPDTALMAVRNEIQCSDSPYRNQPFFLEVAPRDRSSRLFEI